MLNRKNFSNFLDDESLKLISYCPLCNSRYNPKQANIIEEREGAHLIHIKCKKCASSIIALVVNSGLGISSMGLITDLDSREAVKFKEEETISPDDVIEIWSLLEKDEGQGILKNIM